MKWSNSLLLISLVFIAVSCTKETALKKDIFYIQDENRDWLTSDSLGDGFAMLDDNGITQNFEMIQNATDMDQSWGSNFGITTYYYQKEHCYQSYRSSFTNQFDMSIEAGSKGDGDVIWIKVAGVGFAYHFDYRIVSRIDSKMGTKGLSSLDPDYDCEQDVMNSTGEILDEFECENEVYKKVLHFSFKDFQDEWEQFTVTEIYVAKGIGLIKYKLNNGLGYSRVQNLKSPL